MMWSSRPTLPIKRGWWQQRLRMRLKLGPNRALMIHRQRRAQSRSKQANACAGSNVSVECACTLSISPAFSFAPTGDSLTGTLCSWCTVVCKREKLREHRTHCPKLIYEPSLFCSLKCTVSADLILRPCCLVNRNCRYMAVACIVAILILAAAGNKYRQQVTF